MIRITVPATSANLGIGYDTLGMAVSLYSHFTFDRAETLTITGCPEQFQNEDNLVYESFVNALAEWGEETFPVSIDISTEVPVARGLGSSSTCVVAGIMGAAALTGHTVTREELVAIATAVEGHPDNVAPAVFGGATVSWMNEETSEVGSVRLTPPEGIHPVAFIPDFELRTAAARAALPATVPHGDASFNVARGALLAAVLSGNAQASGGADLHSLLMEATRDRLHQEQRRAAMEPSLALVDWMRGAGFAAVVSGAGPTVLSLESVGADIRRDAAAAGWRVVPMGVAPQGVQITRGSLSKVEF